MQIVRRCTSNLDLLKRNSDYPEYADPCTENAAFRRARSKADIVVGRRHIELLLKREGGKRLQTFQKTQRSRKASSSISVFSSIPSRQGRDTSECFSSKID